MNASLRRWLAQLALFAAYFLIALAVTYPLVTQLSSHLAGLPHGDSTQTARHIWWIQRALTTGEPILFQPTLGYPDGIDGLNLWATPLDFFPAWLLAFALPLPAAFNLSLLFHLALNGTALYLLARALGLTAPAAFLAGAVYLWYPTMQGHAAAGHIGLLAAWGAPLYCRALLRLPSGGFWAVVGAALWLFVGALGHTLQVIYVFAPITLVFALVWFVQRDWQAFAKLTAAGLTGGLALGAFLLPVAGSVAGYADEGGGIRYSADLLALVSPSFRHPLWSALEYPRRVLGVNLEEGSAYIGIVTALLGLAALARVRESRRWGALALLAWLLSLGGLLKIFDQPAALSIDGYTAGIALPYALIQDLPLLRLARTPARFNFTLALAAAVLAGYGMNEFLRRGTGRRAWAAALIVTAAILFDTQHFFPLPTTDAAIPPGVSALAGRTDVRAAFDLPPDDLPAAKTALYWQTAHGLPLIAGQVTRRTPVDPAKLAILAATLDPARLRAAGADAVIVQHWRDLDGAWRRRAVAALGEPLTQDAEAAVFLTPPADEAPAFIALPPTTTQIETDAALYLYAPSDGWIDLDLHLEADTDGRGLTLALDGQVVGRWSVQGALAEQIALAVTAGYHTVTLAAVPPCPRSLDPTLTCRFITIERAAVSFAPAPLPAPMAFARAGSQTVRLRASRVTVTESEVKIDLRHDFTSAITLNDIRFVHVLNAENRIIAQQDAPLGELLAGESLAETITLALPDDLPAGEYRIVTGWYAYPDITRFATPDGDMVEIGRFER